MTARAKPRLDLPAVTNAKLNAARAADVPLNGLAGVEARADVPRVGNLTLDALPRVKGRLLARRLVELRLGLLAVHAVLQCGLLRQVKALTKSIPHPPDLVVRDAERRLLGGLLRVQERLLRRAEGRGLRVAARLRWVSAPKNCSVRAASADLVEALLLLRRRYVRCALRACDDGGVWSGGRLRS